jgi:hypothetical protein
MQMSQRLSLTPPEMDPYFSPEYALLQFDSIPYERRLGAWLHLRERIEQFGIKNSSTLLLQSAETSRVSCSSEPLEKLCTDKITESKDECMMLESAETSHITCSPEPLVKLCINKIIESKDERMILGYSSYLYFNSFIDPYFQSIPVGYRSID